MPSFTIYDARYNTLIQFSTETEENCNSISIGSSPKCKISLNDFPDVSGSVESSHFSIIRENSKWMIVNPGNDVKLSDGRRVTKIEISDGMEIVFGQCRMTVRTKDAVSNYDLAWKSNEKINREPLVEEITVIGSSSVCDIVIDSPAIAPKHLEIIQEENHFLIENLSDEYQTLVDQRKIEGKTRIVTDKLFFIGDIPAKIIKQEMPDSIISFNKKRINWKLVNIFLLLVFISVVSITIWNTLDSSNEPDNGETSANKAPLDKTELIKEISEKINSGSPKIALEKLMENENLFTSPSELKDLKNAVMMETSAIELFNLYKTKAVDQLTETHQLLYIKHIFTIPDSEKQVKTDLAFWREIERNMDDLRSKWSKTASPVFEKYHIVSFFISNYDSLRDDIATLVTTYSNYLNMIDKWRKNEWTSVISSLKSISEKYNSKQFKTYVSRIIFIAEEAKNLQNLINEFSQSDIKKYNMRNLRKEIDSYRKSIENFKTFNHIEYHKFKRKLDALQQAADLIEKTRAAFKTWKSAPDNFERFNKVVSFIHQGEEIYGSVPILKKFNDRIMCELNKHITASIKEIRIEPSKEMLRKCENLENFILADATFNSDGDAEKLAVIKNKIKIQINNKCDIFFADFQEAKNSGDSQSMKLALQSIIKLAPENSRYHRWALTQLRNIN